MRGDIRAQHTLPGRPLAKPTTANGGGLQRIPLQIALLFRSAHCGKSRLQDRLRFLPPKPSLRTLIMKSIPRHFAVLRLVRRWGPRRFTGFLKGGLQIRMPLRGNVRGG